MAQLRRLRERFPDELVVIGVHSAKFPSEQATRSIREAVMRHGIEHPVVNDAGFGIWKQYAVRAWPTVVLIDPRGHVVGAQSGEIDAGKFAEVIERMIGVEDARQGLDRKPLNLRREPDVEPDRVLRHPSKLIVTSEATMFVSDTGHHRLLQLELDAGGRSAQVVRVFGSGYRGFSDGSADRAQFDAPHGLARRGRTLYVADTENHAVRAIDLDSGAVRTVAGTGEKAVRLFRPGSKPTETALRSPWALWVDRPRLFIAMAGSHQIFSLEDESSLFPFAGNAREAMVDGAAPEASFNQPSDLAGTPSELFVADPEASAVRSITLSGRPMVRTLVGRGLFEWGDVDGTGDVVRLQHPTGIAVDGLLHIADSYNHKIKRLDPTSRLVKTLAGTGQPGFADGPGRSAQFFEPQGLAVRGKRLFVADTNNHALRVIDLDKMRVETIEVT